MKEIIGNKRGITLIALIVTIIVLLILAGVTIATLTGENGILTRTSEAREKTKEAQEQENNILERYEATIGERIDGTITANVILNSENKNEYYGQIITNYNCQNSEGVENWKIFYADENNIYLIATDYIYKDYCPSPSDENTIKDNGNGYKLSMDNVRKEYNGSEDIINPTIQNLNRSYFEYLNMNQKISTNDNMKAIAYMLDTELWKGFAGEKAEYAIGRTNIRNVT